MRLGGLDSCENCWHSVEVPIYLDVLKASFRSYLDAEAIRDNRLENFSGAQKQVGLIKEGRNRGDLLLESARPRSMLRCI